MLKILKEKITIYWKLIKSLQTGLLLATGLAGFMSCKCPVLNLPLLLGVGISLFLSISGSTVLNMWYDRDIDSKMNRTCYRPFVTGQVSSKEIISLGIILSILGLSMAFIIDLLYGSIIFAGIFFDFVVYTIWLKRKTCWSIIWGGLAGGMPILAGRTLGLGTIDWVGVLLALGILFWIPTHIMTFSIKYDDDYQAARIPTFPIRYGLKNTRWVIAISSILAAIAMAFSAIGIGMALGYLSILIILSMGLTILAIYSLINPSVKLNFSLFKYASIYMLSAMVLMVLI